ncbi:MAG: PKD domain-containing protein [Bacteroidetes bacterium]|nr:PKD domain-containing protein [Bacteroidota bacterium]
MKKLTQFLLLLLITGSTSFAQLANWTPGSNPTFTNFPVNVSGQINGLCRISQMKFHSTDPNKLYAVTGEGGFFASNDGGTNWTVKAGTENLTGSCASLCIDYTNDQIIYLGSGDANYYSNGQGIYKSTDGGNTFTLSTLTNCLVIEIIQDPNNSATFVAATNKGIYKSTNNGANWVATTSTALQFCDLKQNAAANSSTLYACTRENSARFYRSTDFGSNWTQITSGITTAVNFVQAGGRIGVTPADPNVVYFEAIGGGGIVHKSSDGGLNFVVTKPEGAGTASLPYITFYDFDNNNTLTGQGNYNNAIWVDVADPSKLWLQAHNTWLSLDNGATWTEITHWSTKVHTDMHQVQQSPFDANKLFSCNDGGIWLSTDGGFNWTTKSNGLYAYETYNNCGKSSNTDRNYVTLGTQDNGRVFRNAAGWFTDRGGDDTRQKEYDYLPNGGFYYEKTQLNRKSVSSGATSSSGLPTTGNFWEYLAFNRSNTSLGFMWFTDNNLYRTTNLSAAPPTWSSVFTFTVPVMAMHSCVADPNQLYVITNDGKIQVSTNALAANPSFTTFNLPSASSSLASITAIANDANKVYISINNRVYYSSDGGATWTNISYNLPNVNHRKIIAEEIGGTQELVFIATNNAVYYKKAGQITWTNYSTNLPGRRAPTNFTLYDDGTSQSLIRYYTYGRGVWESSFANLRPLNAQITVLNEANPDCSAHTVTYGDASMGNVVSYAWSFPGGNPSTSTSPTPTVSYAANGNYNVSLTVTDNLNVTSSTSISKAVQLIPQIKSALSVIPAPVSADFCRGGHVNLTTNGGVSPSFVELGNGSSVTVGNSSSSTLGPNPLQNWYGGSKQLMLFTAAELNGLGIIGGAQLSGFAVNMPNAVTSYVLQNLQVKIQNTSLTNLSGFLTSGWTVVRNAANYTLSGNGWNTITFNSNYTWDGTSNLLIEINYSNNNGGNSGNTALYGTTTNVSTLLYRADNVTAAAVDTYSGGATYMYSARNNVRFFMSGTASSYSWSPSSGLNIASGTSVVASPLTTTNYTVTATSAGTCPVAASQVVTLLTNTISASAGSNGIISPLGNSTINCGTDLSYTITPDAGYTVQDVLVDGISQGAITSYTFTNVILNHTISASFVANCIPFNWYLDADLDGYYTGAPVLSCTSPGSGYTSLLPVNGSGDCDDANINVHALPAASTITANGPLTFCEGESVTLLGNTSGGEWNTTETSYAINVISSGTYFVTNSNSCGNTNSNSLVVTVTPVSIAPVGVTAASPYTYGFENATPPAVFCGMIISNDNFPADIEKWHTSTLAPHSGNNHMAINANADAVSAKEDWFFTAPLNLLAGKSYRISFWYKGTNASKLEKLEVFAGLLADAANMQINASLFSKNNIQNTTYSNDSSTAFIPSFSGTYYFGFHAFSDANQANLHIDDIQVKEISTTNLNPIYCTTIPSLYSQIFVQPVLGASNYRFKIVGSGAQSSYNFEHYRNNANPDYRLKWAPGVIYGYTYDVSVAYYKNGTWSPYGASCPVSLGAFPTIKLRNNPVTPGFCNYTISDLNYQLFTDSLPGANDYMYKIVENNSGNSYNYDHTWQRFSGNLDYRLVWAYQASPLIDRVRFGYKYDVQTRALVGKTNAAFGNRPGEWGNYGATCELDLSTNSPTTSLSNCNILLASLNQQIFTNPVNGATNYEYEFTAPGYTAVVYRGNGNTDFRLTWIPTSPSVPGGPRYATTYSVRVKPFVGGVWLTYGSACSVTTPSAPSTSITGICGTTLSPAQFNNTLTCTAVPGASMYAYRITNVGGVAYSKVFYNYNSNNTFSLSRTLQCCGQQNLLPNSTYTIEVAYYAGIWSAYGTACTFTTGATVPRYSPFESNSGTTRDNSFNFVIYPNPSKVGESFSLELYGVNFVNEKAELVIYSAMGKKVFYNNFTINEEASYTYQPNIQLAAGVYMAEVHIFGSVYYQKFVVN